MFIKSNISNVRTVMLLGARSQGQPLSGVVNELNELRSIFDESDALVKYEPYLNKKITVESLNNNKDNIDIIHFAGHSSSHLLKADEGDIFLERLAGIFSSWKKKPKLLFINGCDNNKQIDNLLESGISYVIATNGPIDDVVAKNFSLNFYRYLMAGSSLKESIDAAYNSTLIDKSPSEANAAESRSLDLAVSQNKWDVYSKRDCDFYFRFRHKKRSLFLKSLCFIFVTSLLMLSQRIYFELSNPPIIENQITPHQGRLDIGFILRMIKGDQDYHCLDSRLVRRLVYGKCQKVEIEQTLEYSLACSNDLFILSKVEPVVALNKLVDTYPHCLSIERAGNNLAILPKKENYSVELEGGDNLYVCNCLDS